MIARVVTSRDDARLASFVTAVASLFLLLVLADDLSGHDLFGAPPDAMFGLVAIALMVAGVGPWLVWSRGRGRTVHVRTAPGLVVAGRLRIDARDVDAVSVAAAASGSSVAVRYGKRVAFFEVERAEDATRIADVLRAEGRPAASDVVVPPPSRALAVVQVIASVVAVVAAPLYYLAATRALFATSLVSDPKAAFGITGVIAAELSFVWLIVRRSWPGQAVALGTRGAWDTHAALHREQVPGDAGLAAPAGRAVVPGLARGDEEVGAWLARIDAMPLDAHAYRGGAVEKDALWDALGDAGAVASERMAAARVLRRRFGEEPGALVRVVDDPDVRVRVEAALDDHEDAERRIESLGPLFRARRVL